MEAQRRPGRGLIITGIVLIVLALVLGGISVGVVAWGLAGVDFDQFQITQASVPGTIEFQADEPGNYFVNVPGVDNVAAALSFELRDADGESLALQPWQFGDGWQEEMTDEDLLGFHLDEPGRYALVVTNGEQGRYEAVLGRLPTDVMMGMAAAGIAGFCGGGLTVLLLIVGVVILISGLVRR